VVSKIRLAEQDVADELRMSNTREARPRFAPVEFLSPSSPARNSAATRRFMPSAVKRSTNCASSSRPNGSYCHDNCRFPRRGYSSGTGTSAIEIDSRAVEAVDPGREERLAGRRVGIASIDYQMVTVSPSRTSGRRSLSSRLFDMVISAPAAPAR